MLLVTYELKNQSGVDLIVTEIRRHKTKRVGAQSYMLLSEADIDEVKRKLNEKVLPGDEVWIFTVAGPFSFIEFNLTPPNAVIH